VAQIRLRCRKKRLSRIEILALRAGPQGLFKGGQPGEGATVAVVRRKDGYFENAVGGKVEGADSGGDTVERAHACALRELREEVGGLWGFEMVPRLPFLGRVRTWYDGVLCDMHVFLMPVVAPAHRLRLVDRQGGLL
jgi:8-oxo-dGTP pyrophosphatase MutT (NUDIX family)